MQPKQHSKIFSVSGLLGIALITCLIYSDVQQHEFLNWDDKDYIIKNDMLRPLSIDNVVAMFTQFDSANWHPITWLSYALDFSLFGESAPAFKWTNIFIHLLNSYLVFHLTIIILTIVKNPQARPAQYSQLIVDYDLYMAALAAAFLFAISPLHVESVAWISDRKDLLCSFFYLAAVISYLQQHYSRSKLRWRNSTLLLFVLALMSKSIAVTLPVVLVLLDIYPLKKVAWQGSLIRFSRKLLAGKITLFFLSVVVAFITILTQSGQIESVENYGIGLRVVNASINYIYYVFSVFIPDFLSPYHTFPDMAQNLSVISAVPVIIIFALFVLLFIKSRQGLHYPLISMLAYSVLIFPALGLIQVAHAARADRYAYLPTVVIYILLGAGIYALLKKMYQNRALFSSAIIIILGFVLYKCLYTYSYTQDWRNDETMWLKVIAQYPEKAATAYLNLGNVYFSRKQYQRSIENYKKTLSIDSTVFGAYENLGHAYVALKDPKQALRYYKKMISVRPDIPLPYSIVGDFYYKRKKFQEADFYYKKMLAVAPALPGALLRNGLMDYSRGDLADARQKLEYLLMLEPNDIGALQLMARIHLAYGEQQAAKQIANLLLELRPKDGIAREVLSQLNTTHDKNSGTHE